MSQFNYDLEPHFKRLRQLRNHSCPVGCHERSNYPVDQYHEYECIHQKALKETQRLMEKINWTDQHIRELEAQGEDTDYWKYERSSILNQLQHLLEIRIEEHQARKERAEAMPHIYT